MESDNKDYSLYAEEKEVILPEGTSLSLKMIGDSKHEDFKFVLVNALADWILLFIIYNNLRFIRF